MHKCFYLFDIFTFLLETFTYTAWQCLLFYPHQTANQCWPCSSSVRQDKIRSKCYTLIAKPDRKSVLWCRNATSPPGCGLLFPLPPAATFYPALPESELEVSEPTKILKWNVEVFLVPFLIRANSEAEVIISIHTIGLGDLHIEREIQPRGTTHTIVLVVPWP